MGDRRFQIGQAFPASAVQYIPCPAARRRYLDNLYGWLASTRAVADEQPAAIQGVLFAHHRCALVPRYQMDSWYAAMPLG
jgi:hypothetical protein